jgi:hypothetical protein
VASSGDVRVSKFLSLALRHRPQAAGLTLDPEGWANVDALIEGAETQGLTLMPRAGRITAPTVKQSPLRAAATCAPFTVTEAIDVAGA